VDDVTILLEHIDFFDGLDRLDVQLLESLLELLVVGAGSRRCSLDLSAGGSLATVVSWLALHRQSLLPSTASDTCDMHGISDGKAGRETHTLETY